jgi:hypothetical protein
MNEFEYHSAMAKVHVKLATEDDGTIEFDAEPVGEGFPEEGTSPASATLREEGAIVRPGRIGSIDQFYLYGSSSSEVNITYKTENEQVTGKRTVRREINCIITN